MTNILIVDDDKMIAQFIKEVLSARKDCLVNTFSSATKAIEHLANHNYDVIISDFRMPVMDGVTFLKKSRELQPKAIRIMLTVADSKEVLYGSINEAQAHRYLQKPIDSATLNTAIEDSLKDIQKLYQ